MIGVGGYPHLDVTHLLFADQSFSTEQQHRLAAATTAVRQIPPDKLLGSSDGDIVDAVVASLELRALELREDQIYSHGIEDVTLSTQMGSQVVRRPGKEMVQHIPFEGDSVLFSLTPNPYTLHRPAGEVRARELLLTWEGPPIGYTGDAIQAHFKLLRDEIDKYLTALQANVTTFNSLLLTEVETAVGNRRREILHDREIEEYVGIPVPRRGDAVPLLQVHVPKPRKMVLGAPLGKFKPEPAICPEAYADILDVLRSFGAAAERFPETFGQMDEPVLREILLVILNNQFGAAAGEVFSRHGKTDIAILAQGVPVFIAECKIWRGEASFDRGLDQLLGYLTWRDEKAAVVLFVKNQNVSSALEKARGALAEHARSKKPGPLYGASPTWIFEQPGHPAKEIVIALVDVPLPLATPDRLELEG